MTAVVSREEALSMLPDGETIHTLLGGVGFMCGADWTRQSVLKAIEDAPDIRLSGDIAQYLGHGLAVHNNGRWLFVETKRGDK